MINSNYGGYGQHQQQGGNGMLGGIGKLVEGGTEAFHKITEMQGLINGYRYTFDNPMVKNVLNWIKTTLGLAPAQGKNGQIQNKPVPVIALDVARVAFYIGSVGIAYMLIKNQINLQLGTKDAVVYDQVHKRRQRTALAIAIAGAIGTTIASRVVAKRLAPTSNIVNDDEFLKGNSGSLDEIIGNAPVADGQKLDLSDFDKQ